MSGFAWAVRSPNCLRWKPEIVEIKFTTCQSNPQTHRGLTKGPGGGVNDDSSCDFEWMPGVCEKYKHNKVVESKSCKTTVTSARSSRSK